MAHPSDVIGFSREARAGTGKTVCLDLMMALDDEMKAEGIVGQPEELSRRYHAVLSGERPCPLQETCDRFRQAIERGGRPVSAEPVQLSFLSLTVPR